jgi:RNA polymerase sigma-70 factor (ECF subfamily)
MDIKQFEKSVLPLKDKIFRLAFHLLRHRNEAEDLTQEVFLKLWNIRAELKFVENVEAFALKVTRNYCIDKIRIKSRVEAVMELNEDLLDEKLVLEKEIEQKDTVGFVRIIIDSLPETQKTIIHLRDVEGLEIQEIAHITGLNENAIKVNLSRARKKVRDAFKKNN